MIASDNDLSPVLRKATILRWRHNERDGVSNHQPHDCLLDHSFRPHPNKTSKLRVAGLCEGNSPVTGEFPAQMASNAENVSIWWRQHVSEPMIKSVRCKETSMKFESKYKNGHSTKSIWELIWKYCLQNVNGLVLASMCYFWTYILDQTISFNILSRLGHIWQYSLIQTIPRPWNSIDTPYIYQSANRLIFWMKHW